MLLVKGVQVLKTGLRAVELEDASLAEGSALTPEVKTGIVYTRHLLCLFSTQMYTTLH